MGDVIRVLPVEERTTFVEILMHILGMKLVDLKVCMVDIYGYGVRNKEGLKMLEVLDAFDMTVCTTWYLVQEK